MVIDEVENHFNKEIVITLIRFFMDNKLNKMVAHLFSHIIQSYWMNMIATTAFFITRNRNGITVENLSNILKRNDIKKK